MCSGPVSSYAFDFVGRASVQKKKKASKRETPHGSTLLQETMMNHRANSGPLKSQAHLLARLHKSF